MAKVRKAVIAAAGFGTRFMPQTKAMPKEMLPLVDKPIIQHIVEELVDSGIEDIVIVTGYHKRSIEDHFDAPSAELVGNLKKSNKKEILDNVKRITEMANFIYVRQKGPYGNATPVMNTEHIIGDEPFIYAYADDFVLSSPPRFKQLIDLHQKKGGSVLTCVKIENDGDYARYGFIGGDEIEKGVYKTNTIIEKPGDKKKSPSNIASVSGYLLTPEIFPYLHKQKASFLKDKTKKELEIQESMKAMMDDGLDLYGLVVKNGKFYDTGNKLEYIKAVIDFAMQRPEIKPELLKHLRSIVKK
jgi:UTP--glucose-1-phosphate uridylyltransferase